VVPVHPWRQDVHVQASFPLTEPSGFLEWWIWMSVVRQMTGLVLNVLQIDSKAGSTANGKAIINTVKLKMPANHRDVLKSQKASRCIFSPACFPNRTKITNYCQKPKKQTKKKDNNLRRRLLCLFIDALAAWRRSCMIFCRWTGSRVGTGAEITSVLLFTAAEPVPDLLPPALLDCNRGGLPDMTDPWWEPERVCWDCDCDTDGNNSDMDLEGIQLAEESRRWWCDNDEIQEDDVVVVAAVTPAPQLTPSALLKSAMSTGSYELACQQQTQNGRVYSSEVAAILIPIPAMSIIPGTTTQQRDDCVCIVDTASRLTE